MTHQFAPNRCSASQRLRRSVTEELDEVPDAAGVLAHRRDLESIVAADPHFDPTLPHLLVGAAGRFELARQVHGLDDVAGHANRVALVDRVVNETECGTDDNA